jgi:hypothetical protein
MGVDIDIVIQITEKAANKHTTQQVHGYIMSGIVHRELCRKQAEDLIVQTQDFNLMDTVLNE